MIIQRTTIDPITGTAILVGEGLPFGTDAPTGSLFVRKDGGINNILYTKYGTGINDWSVLTSGSAGVGATGPMGPTGVKGDTGDTGATGVQGATGPAGSGTPANPCGSGVYYLVWDCNAGTNPFWKCLNLGDACA